MIGRRRLRGPAGALLAACALALALTATAAQAAERRSFLVTLRPGVAPAALVGAAQPRLLSSQLNAYLVSAGAGARLAAWRQEGAIAIQRDRTFRRAAETTVCTAAPTTPDYMLAAVDAVGVAVPSSTPPIAILDGGLNASQPQFAGRIIKPWNAITKTADASDADGHGTAVAGVAAAAVGSDQGVSPSSPIIPIKIYSADGTATAADLVAAIGTAIADGAGVINLSNASPLSSVDPTANEVVRQAIDTAFGKGILVVAASGNEGSGSPDVPAADPHVISVGAIGESGARARFSNYGLTLDMVAPGVQLTEPAPASVCASGYQIVDGTSFAAPAVSADAALLEAARPSLTASQRFSVIRRSARALTIPGWNNFMGFGVLDVAATLTAAPPSAGPGEVDDDVYWLKGANAATHRPLLGPRKHSGSVSASVERYKDPSDVYRVMLRRGERLQLRLTSQAGVQMQLGVWDPSTGPFEISSSRHRHRLAAKTISVSGSLVYTARRAGTFFVSVAALRTLNGGSAYNLVASGR